MNEKSICLDLGTGGGEKVLKYYPKVKKIYATDFLEDNSQEKRKIEKELFEKYIEKNKTDNGILLKRVLYGIVGIK